jgi:DNA polymerase
MSKRKRYSALVAKRKNCQLCEGLCNPSRVDGGVYDSDEIGPWSRWEGNLDASVVVVGQDWGDVGYFRTHQGLEGPKNPTNTNLVKLLREIGLKIAEPPGEATDDPLFLTNAILCLKTEGGLQGQVQRKWFENCGENFLRPLLEIISPKVVVALGERAFTAVINTFRPIFKMPSRFRDAVDGIGRAGGLQITTDTRLFPVYHCGARIMNTHRRLGEQKADWGVIADFLRYKSPHTMEERK